MIFSYAYSHEKYILCVKLKIRNLFDKITKTHLPPPLWPSYNPPSKECGLTTKNSAVSFCNYSKYYVTGVIMFLVTYIISMQIQGSLRITKYFMNSRTFV